MFEFEFNFDEDAFEQEVIEYITREVNKRLKNLKCDEHDENMTEISLETNDDGELSIHVETCCDKFEKVIEDGLDNLTI